MLSFSEQFTANFYKKWEYMLTSVKDGNICNRRENFRINSEICDFFRKFLFFTKIGLNFSDDFANFCSLAEKEQSFSF